MTAIGSFEKDITSSTYLAMYSQYPSLCFFIHKSASALDGLYPIFLSVADKCSWYLAAELFKPYRDLSIINLLPANLGPNSGPAIMYNFSLVFPYKKAFPTSPAHTFKPFIFASKKPNLTASIDTTPENISSLGTSGLLCPPATSLLFNLPSNLTSYTMWYGIFLYPGGKGSPDSSTLKTL